MNTTAPRAVKSLLITHARHSKSGNSTFSFAIQGRKDITDTVTLILDYGDNTRQTVITTGAADLFCYFGTWNYDSPGYFTVTITAVASPSGQSDTIGTTVYQSPRCYKPQ